ncbi:MAG: ABC transporter substrate-binding protein [Gammaproteobacteria bacterium]|nr:MAG: ABC transporter substrate-binding protein [Gammaproteobacteria bacterium]
MDTKSNEIESSATVKTSRRGFLKTSAVAAGAAIGMGASSISTVHAAKPKSSKGLPITIAGYKNDRVEALMDGRVQVNGFDARFEEDGIGAMNTHIFSGPKTREITEIGLSPFMLAYANEGFRDYTLIPVFPFRVFRHKSIFVRTDSDIKSPADLRGKKVATSGYSSTSLTWLRGIIQHEYGVKPEEIQWYISSKDSVDVKLSGGVSKQEQVMPKNIQLTSGPAGMDESEMLVSGKVDALLHAAEPKAYVEGNPRITRLFTNFRTVEHAYFAKTGLFPIMHAVAVRRDVIDAHPGLPKAIFNAFSQAKKLMYEEQKLLWLRMSLPWIAQEVEETRALMGENYFPYGIEPNRKALDALFQYSYEQGLAKKRLTIEELFHPSTLELIEA